VWPLRAAATAPGWEPVPGLEPVIAATAKLHSTKITTFIEAVLLVWDTDDLEHQEALQPPLQVFVDKAAEFGFIDTDDVLPIRAQARSQTLQRMQAIVDDLPDEYADLRPDLAASIGRTREFAAIAKNAGIRFQATRATWSWPLTTVVEEAVSGQCVDALEWLAREVNRVCNSRLQRAMEAAWRRPFDHSPKGVWLREQQTAAPPTTRVTPTNTEPFDVEFILGPERDLHVHLERIDTCLPATQDDVPGLLGERIAARVGTHEPRLEEHRSPVHGVRHAETVAIRSIASKWIRRGSTGAPHLSPRALCAYGPVSVRTQP
jgi:hypothetical protein